MTDPMSPRVGDVWRDGRAARDGYHREVRVDTISGGFRYCTTIIGRQPGRETRIHEQTLRRDFILISRSPWVDPDE